MADDLEKGPLWIPLHSPLWTVGHDSFIKKSICLHAMNFRVYVVQIWSRTTRNLVVSRHSEFTESVGVFKSQFSVIRWETRAPFIHKLTKLGNGSKDEFGIPPRRALGG